MQKIYAKILNPESYDYRVYDISEDDGNRVIIDGGRQFCDIDRNGELKAIKRMLANYSDYDLNVYYDGSIKAYIKDELYPLKKDNGKDFSPREIHIIKELIDDDTKDEAIEIILSILHGEKYICKTLKGYCQGDVVYAYAPASEESYLDWVEAWFFGTGTEIMIHDEEGEPQNADEVIGYTFYTSSWRITDIIDEIREYAGVSKDTEVVLWEYKHTRTIKVDEYELAEQ